MPDYLVTDPATGQRIKMTGPAPPSEALIRLALAKVQPLPSHVQQTQDPLQAMQKAQTIGPARVGERYMEPLRKDLPSIARSIVGGEERPASVVEQDPSGMKAALMGAGTMPMPFMGSVEEPAMAGLYSRLDQAIAKLPDQKLPPMKILSTAKNATSGEEIAHRGLADFLQAAGGKPVARADVQAHLAANPINLDVQTLGVAKAPQAIPEGYRVEKLAEPMSATVGHGRNYTLVGPDGSGSAFHATDAADAENTARMMLVGKGVLKPESITNPTKYSQYQIPGGTAYKETLITLPTKGPQFDPAKVEIKRNLRSQTQGETAIWYDGKKMAEYGDDPKLQNSGLYLQRPDSYWEDTARKLFEQGDKINRIAPSVPGFQSSHFDQPNILVHVRSNERTLPSGEPGLFLEEVQSDWHQKGKAEGYSQNPVGWTAKLLSAPDAGFNHWEISDANGNYVTKIVGGTKESAISKAAEKGVPDAPFKEQWPDLALKHQLLDAAKRPDLQWLGFTSGETQAARYDLSQTVDKIAWEPKISTVKPAGEGTMVSIYLPKNGSIPVKVPVGVDGKIGQTYQASAHQFEGKQLADVVGKDVADHIMGKASGELAGEGLNIGGKGMRFFYDNLLPKRLEKIVKPFGGTVERAPVSGTNAPADVIQRYANQPDHPFTKTANTPAWIVRLTPEMKQRILKEGLPLMTGMAAVAASQQEQK